MIRFQISLVTSLLFLLLAGPPQVKPPSASVPAQSAAAPQAPAPAASLPKSQAGYHFPVGQTLVYGAEWRVFDAGIATLHMEQVGQEQRVVGMADAAGSVALLYHVHDRFESFFNSTTLCSRSLTKNTEEGLRRVNTNINFDYQRGKAVLDQKNLRKGDSKHTENDIPGCVTDVLSGLYYVGSLPLQIGSTYSFPLNDGGKTVAVDVHVEAHEQVKTPAGTFNTIRVQPESSTGVLKEKGKIWIWYSDDAARIPVQLRGRMFWGTLTVQLQRVEKK